MKWLEITVTTAPPAVEAIADFLLACRSGGVAEEPVPSGRVRLRAYVPVGPAAGVTRSALEAFLRRLPGFGLDAGSAAVEVREVDDEGWAHAWKAHFRPFKIGRLWVTPTWDHSPPPAGSLVIELDPGMAFGSGLHPSTRMCLEVLSRRLRDGAMVFDVGTGSGILAIAAAKLGAARVLARDNDPVAVDVARGNVAHNRVAGRVTVEEGHLLDGVEGKAHLILANLTAEIHLEFLPEAPSKLAPGGRLAAAGIVADRAAEVEAVARRAGFTVLETMRGGEWRGVVLEGPG